MVIGLDHGVMMADDHLVAASDGADGGPRRQADFLNAPAHYFRGFIVAMGDGVNRLGGAPAQRMHLGDVATPDMSEQTADGGLLR